MRRALPPSPCAAVCHGHAMIVQSLVTQLENQPLANCAACRSHKAKGAGGERYTAEGEQSCRRFGRVLCELFAWARVLRHNCRCLEQSASEIKSSYLANSVLASVLAMTPGTGRPLRPARHSITQSWPGRAASGAPAALPLPPRPLTARCAAGSHRGPCARAWGSRLRHAPPRPASPGPGSAPARRPAAGRPCSST